MTAFCFKLLDNQFWSINNSFENGQTDLVSALFFIFYIKNSSKTHSLQIPMYTKLWSRLKSQTMVRRIVVTGIAMGHTMVYAQIAPQSCLVILPITMDCHDQRTIRHQIPPPRVAAAALAHHYLQLPCINNNNKYNYTNYNNNNTHIVKVDVQFIIGPGLKHVFYNIQVHISI